MCYSNQYNKATSKQKKKNKYYYTHVQSKTTNETKELLHISLCPAFNLMHVFREREA